MNVRNPTFEGMQVAKDKKKKKDNNKVNKVKKKDSSGSGKAASSLKALSNNPIVADIVAAALVSMAAALKDSDKARRLASEAGDELKSLAKTSAKQGTAMWDMALDIGRRTLEELNSQSPGAKPKRSAKSSKGEG